MNQLRENAFWVGIAAAGGILVALYVLMVMPVQAEAERNLLTARKLEKDLAKPKIYSTEDVKSHEERRASLRAQYKQITDFYVASDQKLETWLGGGTTPPARDGFMTQYRDAIQKLEGRLRTAGVQIGIPDIEDPSKFEFGFRWEIPSITEFNNVTSQGANETEILRAIQKRYWIRERVANVILGEGGEPVKVAKIVDFHFFANLHRGLATAPWMRRPPPELAPVYKNFGRSGTGPGFSEEQLPEGLGQTITFGFGLMLPNSEVPKFIKGFLNPPSDQVADQRILVHVIHSDVMIREQNKPVVRYTFTKGNRVEQEANRKKALEAAGARNVMLSMTCQVIDFNPAKIDDFKVEEKPEEEKKK